MLWASVVGVLWACVLAVCFGRVFWPCVLAVCFERVFWAYALGICFECMALEHMALDPSLWVRGFGHMSFGV